jgi:hypothetical protein
MLESGGLFFFISPIEHSFTGLVKNTVKRILGKPCAYLCPYTCSFHLIGFSKKGIKLLAKESGLEVVKHVRRYDYAWLNMTEKYSVAVKMVAAPVLYFADLVGWGCNQEIVMRKRP